MVFGDRTGTKVGVVITCQDTFEPESELQDGVHPRSQKGLRLDSKESAVSSNECWTFTTDLRVPSIEGIFVKSWSFPSTTYF